MKRSRRNRVAAKPGPVTVSFPYGRRYNLPYLMGVYLAVNAIDDVWLVVDGPDCAHFKGQFVYGKHDWYSTLYRVDGRHRILFTGTNAQNISWNRDRIITRALARAASVDEAGAVMLTSMPLCGLTGVQYDRLIDAAGIGKPVVEIPGWSLRGDWLDGYAQTMLAIARHKEIRAARPRKDAVAIIGYLMDRNEGDHVGNLAELKRTFRALGLDLVSVWPSGRKWQGLDDAAGAGIVISFPYARAAARVLAQKIGGRLLETGVPIGLDGTRRWVERVGAFAGREARAKKFVRAEIRRVVPRIERVIPFYFLNRGVHLFCDPYLVEGLAGYCTDLGMVVRLSVLAGRKENAPERVRDGKTAAGPAVFEPVVDGLHGLIDEAGARPGDLVIGDGECVRMLRRRFPAVEIGVPSYTHHVFADTPFLGFEGALHLVNRMANAISAVQN